MKTFKMIFIVMAILLINKSAFAQLVDSKVRINHRCEEDSLGVEASIGRLAWSLSCKHISKRLHDANLYDDDGNMLARPYYPIYTTEDLTKVWKAPITASDKNCYQEMVKTYNTISWCESSCYTPDQLILFDDGETPILEARTSLKRGVRGLAKGATLNNIEFETLDVEAYTESIKDTNHVIFHFQTENGGDIKVTDNHPMVSGDGVLKEAAKFKVGEFFITENGSKVAITHIAKEPYYGKVYNIKPRSKNLENHIVVAQGLLAGSSMFQNDGIRYIERVNFREKIDLNNFK